MRTEAVMEDPRVNENQGSRKRVMTVLSPAFRNGEKIPKVYSRDSLDKSPPLLIDGVPAEAKGLVLIMEDPDAPSGLFTHWVLFNLAPQTRQIVEDNPPLSARAGANSWGEITYGGPQPPSGEHRYFFRLYALDCELNLPDGVRREALEKEMAGHIITEAALLGKFSAEKILK